MNTVIFCLEGKINIVTQLMETGADVNDIDYRDNSALHFAAINGKFSNIR